MGHPGKRRNFFGRTLRIASGHDNLAMRIFATNAANGRARILIRRSSDRARVQDHDFRSGWRIGSCQTPLLELALDRSTIGLCSPATKILYVEARHGSFPHDESALFIVEPRRLYCTCAEYSSALSATCQPD
jgi:hypothetical protein